MHSSAGSLPRFVCTQELRGFLRSVWLAGYVSVHGVKAVQRDCAGMSWRRGPFASDLHLSLLDPAPAPPPVRQQAAAGLPTPPLLLARPDPLAAAHPTPCLRAPAAQAARR